MTHFWTRTIFWLTVLLGAVVTGAAWFLLPDQVPMHFGGSGVDRWGTRTEAVILFAGMTVGLGLFFRVLAFAVPRTPEALLNLPTRDKQWWLGSAQRREKLNAMVVKDLYAIGAATVLLMVVLQIMIMVEARQAEPAMASWFWVVLAIYLMGVLGYTGYAVAVRYRAPRDGRASRG